MEKVVGRGEESVALRKEVGCEGKKKKEGKNLLFLKRILRRRGLTLVLLLFLLSFRQFEHVNLFCTFNLNIL